MPYQHFSTKEQYVISHMFLADFIGHVNRFGEGDALYE
jgi:hypothetical protein